jgi:hypothetical protein
MDTGLLGELARRSPVPIAATTANVSGTADPLHPGTALLDSTELTAEQALSALDDIVQSGRGRLHCQPRQT